MDASTTRVPEVIDALLGAVQAPMQGLDVQVLDGPPAQASLDDDVLVIGFIEDEEASVENDVERQPGLGHRYREVFNVKCVISSMTGDLAMKPRRDQCKAILDVVDATLKASRGLGGTADLVGLGPSMRWGQVQTTDGAACSVAFSIVGKALL